MRQQDINQVREAALRVVTVEPSEALVMALVYVGDAIREASPSREQERALENIGVQIGGLATAVADLGAEVAHS